ncbi:Scr1 family TA system antitoxin-like transcriptional regulator [Saccharopolyspora indica]|uniref:Scr1 family TA system antitoxin-like transcriptional regulator n=1 Tax=Saccharopolyspora indica TaxID=1229659 RepID=UPI0022EAF912|nr:Scr1 family TA system antitoxin-like transcriptional regulator [Saccharopolyspora indica]MDA3645058.1 Scr1 family TA system antitoxin-like transcriptional regulator [Saccharopolyspora indica]
MELAYMEGAGEIRYLDDKKALTAHEPAWARLTSTALRFDETRAFLRTISRELLEETKNSSS